MFDTPSPIAQFIATTNAGDSDAFVALFSEDGTLDDWGRISHGHENVRQWDRTDNIGKRSRFELVSIVEESLPETYLVHLRVTGHGFNGVSPFRFTLRGNLIQHVVIIPD